MFSDVQSPKSVYPRNRLQVGFGSLLGSVLAPFWKPLGTHCGGPGGVLYRVGFGVGFEGISWGARKSRNLARWG